MPIRPVSSAIERRRTRIRSKLKASGRPRLSVHRTLQHIYAQIIDDATGRTLAAAHDFEQKGTKIEKATKVGAQIGEKAIKAGVTKVVFDRGIFAYHGRIKAIAEAARKAGLQF